MNKLLDKMQKKFGKYAVPHLSAVIVGCYAVGYILRLINPNIIAYMYLDPYMILRGQVWRLITWLVIPPTATSIFTIIMLIFYFSIGRSLERAWGDFRYNVYIFGGILITIVSAFVMYFIFMKVNPLIAIQMGPAFSTYYICMSIFLAFAATFPNAVVLLYFVIPLKVKWLGLLYAAFLGYDAYKFVRVIAAGAAVGWVYLIAMLVSFVNFILFFFSTRNMQRISPQEIKRRREFQQRMQEGMRANQNRGAQGPYSAGGAYGGAGAAGGAAAGRPNAQRGGNAAGGRPAGLPRHVCTVCGRTELTNPELEFRVCSKCGGFHEYCQDHLFTHEHIH